MSSRHSVSYTGSSRCAVSSGPTTAHSAPILSAAALRTRKTGSSASEMISGRINWQQSSLDTTGASEPSSCVATTRFTSASSSCARQSTGVRIAGPTSSGRSSPARAMNASAAASSSCALPPIPISGGLLLLSSPLRMGTHRSMTTWYAVTARPSSSAPAKSGSASSTRASGTSCSASACRMPSSGSQLTMFSSGTSSLRMAAAPISSAQAPSSCTCTSLCTETALWQ
mmetsp:Transcript_8354/g.27574  ORF Transcript_8354/g.27574 Transcript_8354/m.27574 type:complete len:228 (-) Transcript_8354:141-824(-)